MAKNVNQQHADKVFADLKAAPCKHKIGLALMLAPAALLMGSILLIPFLGLAAILLAITGY